MPEPPRPFARLSFSIEPAVGAGELGQQVRIQVDDALGKRERTAFVPEPPEDDGLDHHPGGPCPDCPEVDPEDPER